MQVETGCASVYTEMFFVLVCLFFLSLIACLTPFPCISLPMSRRPDVLVGSKAVGEAA